MADIRIVLDQPNGIQTPGILSGHVYIKCKEPLKARKVTLDIHGSAKTSWTVHERVPGYGNDHYGHHTYVPYYTEIVYLNKRIIIWQPSSDSERFPAGESRLNFALQIDRVLPPPLESEYGYIRYDLKANIDRPNWPDTSTKLNFYLSPNFDLNYNPAAFKPLSISETKEVGSCCKSGRVELTMSLEKSGYAIGEEALITLNVNNQSHRDVCRIEVQLFQEVSCSADRHQRMLDLRLYHSHGDVEFRKDTRVVANFEKELVVAKSTSSVSTHSFQIPSVTPTFNGICNIIEAKHFLRVKAYVKSTFCDDQAICTVPIIIGTSPAIKKSDRNVTASQTTKSFTSSKK